MWEFKDELKKCTSTILREMLELNGQNTHGESETLPAVTLHPLSSARVLLLADLKCPRVG